MHEVVALSQSGYDALKLIHVLAAIAWVGAGAYAQVYASRLIAQKDFVQLAGFSKQLEKIALIYIMPMSILVVVSGVILVWLSTLDFTTTWVWIGLIGYAATFVTGAFFLGPEAGRLGKLVDERPAEDRGDPGGDRPDPGDLPHRPARPGARGGRHGAQAGLTPGAPRVLLSARRPAPRRRRGAARWSPDRG